MLMLAQLLALSAASTCPADRSATARSAAGLTTELREANGPDKAKAYARYIASFRPDATVWGLVPDRAATLDDVKHHYHAVFFDLGGGTLVEDEHVVAGPMAAHRYHSAMTLNGTFDGVVAKDRRVMLRGQTFFRFGDDGKIAER